MFGALGLQTIGTSYHLIDTSEAQLCHQLAHLRGDKAHEVDDIIRLAAEAAAQLRILCRDANRAGVQIADSHHNATKSDQRAGREAEFLSAQ